MCNVELLLESDDHLHGYGMSDGVFFAGLPNARKGLEHGDVCRQKTLSWSDTVPILTGPKHEWPNSSKS
jgi:hypothetical protein